jgi:hypothetical protein
VSIGCGKDDNSSDPDAFGRCADFEPLRQPFFGETHVHTVLSLDANLQGTRPTPMDAYEFARGKTIPVQPYDDQGNGLRSATIDRPLDFVMVSDHAEFLATIVACNDPEHPSYDQVLDDGIDCVDYRDPEQVDQVFIFLNGLTARSQDKVEYPALCGENNEACIDAGIDAWERIQEVAEAVYDRTDSCEFTSFIGYEWSGGPGTNNLHRNIMFANESVTDLPYSYFDEPYVEGLWARLQKECIDASNRCDVLTIPHNSNLSNGNYFLKEKENGEPFDAEYVAARNAMEPIIEIYQHKGASECLPGEMISDELCGFEILPFSNLASANLQGISEPNRTGFLRYAYGQGMKFEESLGTNPFQYGITAATDTHISAPGFIAENDFKGHGGAGQPNRFLPPPEGFPDIEYFSPGGLTAVWAEENARKAIFAAIRRKETFGTSGPRIVVRMFGGWDYPDTLCDSPDFAQTGYDNGVPMGGTLSAQPMAGAAPKFAVLAKQDPGTEAHPGTPLQRIQIVKGWLENGNYQVEVHDVAGNRNNGATVDLSTCTQSGPGEASLCAVWEDEDFDPTQRAYYYARVIENPTCRWTTQQCVASDYDCENPTTEMDFDCCDPTSGLNVEFCDSVADGLSGMEAECCRTDNPISWANVDFCNSVAMSLPPAEGQCCLPRVEPIIQERAWTSPIWYQPPS